MCVARFTVVIPRRMRILFKVRQGLRERQWYDWSLCSKLMAGHSYR